MRLLGLVVALILVAAHSVSLGQERRCDGDCSDRAPLPPGEGAPTPSPPPAAAPADDKQRRPPPPPDEAKPPPVESDVALHFTNHVHVTQNDTWDPPGHVHRDVVVENGSSLSYAASFLSHSVTGDDGEELEPATPASVLNNTIALGEDGSKAKVLLDSSNNLKEPDLFHDEDTARVARVQTPSTGKLEVNTTAAFPETAEQQSSKNDTSRESIDKEDRPPEIVVTQEPSKNLGTTKADQLLDMVTQEPVKNNSNNNTSHQEHEETEIALAAVNRNKTEITTKPPSPKNGDDTQERRSSTRLVIKKVTKTESDDDEASSTPLPRENKIYHGSSRRRTQEVTTLRPRRRGTTTQQPETTVSSTLRSFRRKSYTDATVVVDTTTAAATRRRPSEEDSEDTMVRVELSTMPSRRSTFRPLSASTARTTTTTTTSNTITSSSSVSTSRGRVKFFDSSSSRTTTTTPYSSSGSSSLVPMRRLLLPPTPSPGTRVQEPRPFSLGMQENKHVAVHVPAPPTTTAITTTEDSSTSSSTTVLEEAWTTEDDEDAFVATTTKNSKVNGSSEADDDEAVLTTMTWPMTTTTTTKSPDRSIPNEPDSTVMVMTDPVTTDRPEEASTVTFAPTERVETQPDTGEEGEDASTTLMTTVTSPFETSCFATFWASGEELCRRLGDVRDAFVAALKANNQQDGDNDREVPPPSGWDVSLSLLQPHACDRLKVARRRAEVTVRGLPDGCMHLLDLWHADNLASPFQVKQFRVPGVEPPGIDDHTDDLEDDNTTVSTTATFTSPPPPPTTTTSAVDEEETTTVGTTTEEVPPPAQSGGGGEDGNNAGVVAAIVVSSVGGVCLVLLAVLLVVLRRRQRRFRSYGQRCTPVSLDAYSLDSVSVGDAASVRSRRKGVLRASKRSYGNAAFTLDERDPASPSHPLTFAGLAAFCADNSAAIEAEFALVPQVSVTTDELPPGADVKNRYANVTPLPETRVQLSRRGDDPLSTYINANYVKGPDGEPRFYIATQAPMASTVTDFWRMVWEQQSRTILMATLLVENGVERCCDYLPPSEVLDCHRVFGDFQITLKKRDQKDHYVVSTLQIKNLETNLWREVTHLWLVSWPCEGVPEDPRSVVAFLVEARPFTKAAGPVVVHCSPGTGRTGTLIACDVLLRHFEKTRTVDVPRCVAAIRRERAGAVKTSQQYVFIYKLLNLYAAMLTGGALDSL